METASVATAAGVDRKALQQRLAELKVVDSVMPTRPLDGESLHDVRRSLNVGFAHRADEALGATLFSRGFKRPQSDAFAQLATSPALVEQLTGFAAAGLAFMSMRGSYANLSLRQRAEIGGNTAVTRVLLQDERLLLETERLNIRFRSGVSKKDQQEVFANFGLVPVRALAFAPNLSQAISTKGPSRDVALGLLSDDRVEHAAPDFIEFVGRRYTPSDPLYPQQWHLNNRQFQGADVRAEAAWNQTSGAGVRIAVVDNGFDRTHTDLVFSRGSAWYRSTPDMADADLVGGTAGMPDNNHGTACAGMAAARSGNGSGGCGVAFGAELMAIACLGDQVGTQSTLARAIAYAADPSSENAALTPEDGADLIACSLGPNAAAWPIQPVLTDAINFAVSQGRRGRGAAIFWATTNGNYPIGADEVASHPSVIAVGRSTNADSDDGSGFGPELAFLAPGVGVYIPQSGGGYQTITGTSFACPCAAGVGALVLAVNPGLSASDVGDILRDTCDKVGNLPYNNNGNGRNDRFGHGRVNAELATRAARTYIPRTNRFAGV